MNFNLYLPDDLGTRAKAAGLPLSQLLRSAVESELDRMAALKSLESEMSEIELELQNQNGDDYIGELTGVCLSDDGRLAVYATDDARVILYDAHNLRHFEIEDPAVELRDAIGQDEYLEVMRKLGMKARVAL